MSTFVLDKMQFISNICKFVVANLLTYTICFYMDRDGTIDRIVGNYKTGATTGGQGGNS